MSKLTELEKKIKALPPNPMPRYKWTLEEDAMIMKYAEEKGIPAIAKALGKSAQLVRRRYQAMREEMKK